MKVLSDRFWRRTLAFLGNCRETARNLTDPPLLSRESGPKKESLPNKAVVAPAVTWRVGYHIFPSSHRTVAPLFQILRYVIPTLSLAASLLAVSQAQIVANTPSIGGISKVSTPSVSLGIRPDHLWSVDYVKLLWSDTGAVLTAPVHWDRRTGCTPASQPPAIGAAASLDNTIEDNVQAHRTAGEDRFFNQYQNLGAAWAFGLIGAFEIWGEAGGNTTAKNTAMDALTASIIGPGLIGTSMKYAVGRVRPNTATSAFEFKPFSNNQSFPSGPCLRSIRCRNGHRGELPGMVGPDPLLRRSRIGRLRSDRTKRPLC
jgi:hypothetical protein